MFTYKKWIKTDVIIFCATHMSWNDLFQTTTMILFFLLILGGATADCELLFL